MAMENPPALSDFKPPLKSGPFEFLEAKDFFGEIYSRLPLFRFSKKALKTC